LVFLSPSDGTLAHAGTALRLGISNVTLEQLQALIEGAAVKPSFVQNRCYAKTGWDRAARALCSTHGIRYQGFSLLTGNRSELASSSVKRIAARAGRPVEQVVFRFCQQIGMLPLTGTSRLEHMRLDLACSEVELAPDEVAALEAIDQRD
jgi:diketogulonate reductase-like aldo/keto reductase